MELLNVARARSIWIFDLNDLNPRGKSVGTDLLEWIKEAYGFSKFPQSTGDHEADTQALAFLDGTFQIREEFFISVDLRIYNDGLVADTRSSTDDTDLFLKDVLESAVKEFSLTYASDTVRRTLYLSELNVVCDRDLSLLNPRLHSIADKISRLSKSANPKPNFAFSSLAFWAEPFAPNAEVFRFEKKQNTSASENRYYSSAPMMTSDHLDVLKEIEASLTE